MLSEKQGREFSSPNFSVLWESWAASPGFAVLRTVQCLAGKEQLLGERISVRREERGGKKKSS